MTVAQFTVLVAAAVLGLVRPVVYGGECQQTLDTHYCHYYHLWFVKITYTLALICMFLKRVLFHFSFKFALLSLP